VSSGLTIELHEQETTARTSTRYGGFGLKAQARAGDSGRTIKPTAEPKTASTGPPRRKRHWPAVAALGFLLLFGLGAAFHFALVLPLHRYNARVQQARERMYYSRVRHDGPVAALADLQGEGRLFLLPLGTPTQPYGAQQIAAWLRAMYKLDVTVLPSLALDRATWDGQRHQYVAELVGEQMERAHPEVIAEPHAVMIGITDQSMYWAQGKADVSYSARMDERAAVVSTYGFEDHGLLPEWAYKRQPDPELPAKLRRFVLKNVAMLHWHLPLNNDPSSLLHDELSPEVQTESLYASDLHPRSSKWGEAMTHPCLYFTWSAKDGVRTMAGPDLRPCDRKLLETTDEARETVEVDLLGQVVRDARTDLYLPDSVPIVFERVLRPGATRASDFGVSGSHSYNTFLWATSMTMLHKVGPEFTNEDLRREPWWLPMESLNRWVDADSSGRLLTMTFHAIPRERFELKDLHGNVESYQSCVDAIPCFLNGERNAQGETLRFERRQDDERRLELLTSPNGSWLKLVYNRQQWLTEILDSRGRSVLYRYDAQGNLVSVSHANGEVVSYAYDDKQRLLAVSAATDAASAPEELLRNVYDPWGRLMRQTLANGSVYSYAYHAEMTGGGQWMTVTMPDGQAVDVISRGWRAALSVAG
jgi:YD repeat-containing protein